MRSVAVVMAGVLLVSCGPSGSEVKSASDDCLNLYKEKRASAGADVQAGDHWTKEGKLVIELQERTSASDSSYDSSYCVVDTDRGTIEIPSVFENARWSR